MNRRNNSFYSEAVDSLTRLSPSSAAICAANSIMCPLMVHLAQPLRVRREPIACLTYDLIPSLVTGVESGREIVTLTSRLGPRDLDCCRVASRALASSSPISQYRIKNRDLVSFRISLFSKHSGRNNMFEFCIINFRTR